MSDGERPKEPDGGLESGRSSRWLAAIACVAALGGSLGLLSRAGVWDPPELETAELARRIAAGLLGAPELALEGEGVPTRGELGRGELPFTSIALGFRLFGLSAWAGRLPLALWALVGLAALYLLVRRLGSARAAWLAVLVLATTPLYFLHARTLLGDVVTMSAGSAALAGLALAAFDARLGRARWALFGLGVVFLGAGFLSRGLVIGVAVPALGVGLAWILLALSGERADRLGTAVGALALLGGGVAAGLGAIAAEVTPPELYSMWVGATTSDPRPTPTFDLVLRDLGHALFPWSAVVPFAVARTLGPPVEPEPGRPRRILGLVLVSTAGVALVAHAAIAPRVGLLPFAAPAALAAIAALALAELDRDAEPAPFFGLAVGALVVVLLFDLRNIPEKALVAFGVPGAAYPEGFASAFTWLAPSALGAAMLFFFLAADRETAAAGVFRGRDYARWPHTLRRIWSGNLFFGVVVAACALVGFDLIQSVSRSVLAVRALDGLGEMSRLAVRAGWFGILAVCAAPLAVLLGRDVVRLARAPGERFARPAWLARVRLERGASAAVLIALSGGVASFVYYPRLLDQLSPKEVFDAYQRAARPGERLGVLGVDAASARYHAGGEVWDVSDPDAAIAWLLGGGRRFLAFRSEDLAELNAGHRARTTPSANLPILDASSSEILLAVSRLGAGERDENPLADVVLAAEPKPSRPLDVDLGGRLRVLGWDVREPAGDVVDHVVPGRAYDFVIYYRVTDRITGKWETFIHVDGFQRRFNGDHPTLQGKVPFALWRRGDLLADRYRFRLEPNFGAGRYRVYFGLYAGSRRLEVRRGDHDENRVVAGTLEVR